ncbi:profilin-2-like [Pagrus major]|uniref:profilin-2-like n=1 Tax=Pagrus major TaxID=143350 RepID=UPI003CC85469
MSWDQYITNLKADSQVEEAAIWGCEKGAESKWAGGAGLDCITADEIKKLVGDRSAFRQCGPHIGGKKCMLLNDHMDTDGVHSLNLKTAADSDGNRYSICVGKTAKALVIVKGTKDANGGHLSDLTFKTVDYLRKSGF